jgi:hypothetical protein
LASKVAILTPSFLELFGQLSIFFLQGEEAPANLRQVPNNGLKRQNKNYPLNHDSEGKPKCKHLGSPSGATDSEKYEAQVGSF